MGDFRVIQHCQQVLCDRIQEICDGLELNWVGIHKDLDTQPKDDEEATVYCSLYRIDDMDDFGLPAFAVKPYKPGPAAPDPKREDFVQIPARFFYLYFIVFVESSDTDLANALMGAVMNGFHQEPTLLYRPVTYEIDGKFFDSLGRALEVDGHRITVDPDASPQEGAHDKLRMEKISAALVDDLAFGDACLLLKGFERKVRPYLTYRIFTKIDQPLKLVARPGGVRLSLFDTDTGDQA
ncbi:MAG: hypothetical protein GY898_18055 [Proteobacteria bacterium]|nr:hypothetical protein [Pseudomonadota bacterium]